MLRACQRDIFPLAPFNLFKFSRKDCSRSICRRLNCKNNTLLWANDGVQVLNRISGFPNGCSGSWQFLCYRDDILSAYGAMGKPPCDYSSPQGAFRESFF